MPSPYLILRRRLLATSDVFAARVPDIRGRQAAVIEVEIIEAARAAVQRLAERQDTLAVAPVIPMKLIAPVPAGPGTARAEAWGLAAVKAHETSLTGQGIVVAVVDTGIDAEHPAFTGVELIQEDFTGEGIGDPNGHGTHCAGTIFGRPVDGVPIGVAPGVTKAVIAKVLDANGSGSSESLVKGILWAVDQGAHVISMSIGMDFPGLVQQMVDGGLPVDLATSRALEAYRANTRLFDSLAALVGSGALASQNTVIVAAAGNESRRDLDPDYAIAVAPPAVADGIVSVGALALVGDSYQIAPFSNTGVNVAGPGVDILSARAGGGLVSYSGTSMAAPHVAGAAALWAQKLMQSGPLNDFQLISKLVGTASELMLQPGSEAVDYGAGMVQCPQS